MGRSLAIRAKEQSVRPVTRPLNMTTSPYAMRMMVRFLKILLDSVSFWILELTQPMLTCRLGWEGIAFTPISFSSLNSMRRAIRGI